MFIDIRFTDIHCVEDGTRKGLMVDVKSRVDGSGCIDKNAMNELRGELFDVIRKGLPLCFKAKGAAK